MARPKLTHVDSSGIQAVGYDEEARELYVRFHSGRTYIYEGVLPRVYQELMSASSKGRYFNGEIRSTYRWREE